MSDFKSKALAYWTPERLQKTFHGKRFPLTPLTGATLLRTLGILNADASISIDALRKFNQINHLWLQFEPHLKDLCARLGMVKVLDVGCGSAYLTFLVEWGLREVLKSDARLIGVDFNQSLVSKCIQQAEIIGVGERLKFEVASIDGYGWKDALMRLYPEFSDVTDEKKMRPNVVMALHACDTATDDAIYLGIHNEADFIAVAPCCQAELAKAWGQLTTEDAVKSLPMSPVFFNPHLRREIAAHMTDMQRVLLLRSKGYEVTTTEFTLSHSTPKNTLITAIRRGRFHEPSWQEYLKLKDACGGVSLRLEKLLNK